MYIKRTIKKLDSKIQDFNPTLAETQRPNSNNDNHVSLVAVAGMGNTIEK